MKFVAWISVLSTAFVTLSPLQLRPVLLGNEIDRFIAFSIIGFLFSLAYPKAIIWLLVILICGAAIMEIAQNFIPGRHGHAPDFLLKAVGSVVGSSAASFINRFINAEAAEIDSCGT